MPTVIGFLWPWAINTVPPPPLFFLLLALISKLRDIGFSSFTYLLHWTQIWRVIDVEPASWIFSGPLLWKRRGWGVGLQHVSVLLIKVEEDRIIRVPRPLPSPAVLNLQGRVLRRFLRVVDIDQSFSHKGWRRYARQHFDQRFICCSFFLKEGIRNILTYLTLFWHLHLFPWRSSALWGFGSEETVTSQHLCCSLTNSQFRWWWPKKR